MTGAASAAFVLWQWFALPGDRAAAAGHRVTHDRAARQIGKLQLRAQIRQRPQLIALQLPFREQALEGREIGSALDFSVERVDVTLARFGSG